MVPTDHDRCNKCGRQTHLIDNGKLQPMNNQYVVNGICRDCRKSGKRGNSGRSGNWISSKLHPKKNELKHQDSNRKLLLPLARIDETDIVPGGDGSSRSSGGGNSNISTSYIGAGRNDGGNGSLHYTDKKSMSVRIQTAVRTSTDSPGGNNRSNRSVTSSAFTHRSLRSEPHRLQAQQQPQQHHYLDHGAFASVLEIIEEIRRCMGAREVNMDDRSVLTQALLGDFGDRLQKLACLALWGGLAKNEFPLVDAIIKRGLGDNDYYEDNYVDDEENEINTWSSLISHVNPDYGVEAQGLLCAWWAEFLQTQTRPTSQLRRSSQGLHRSLGDTYRSSSLSSVNCPPSVFGTPKPPYGVYALRLLCLRPSPPPSDVAEFLCQQVRSDKPNDNDDYGEWVMEVLQKCVPLPLSCQVHLMETLLLIPSSSSSTGGKFQQRRQLLRQRRRLLSLLWASWSSSLGNPLDVLQTVSSLVFGDGKTRGHRNQVIVACTVLLGFHTCYPKVTVRMVTNNGLGLVIDALQRLPRIRLEIDDVDDDDALLSYLGVKLLTAVLWQDDDDDDDSVDPLFLIGSKDLCGTVEALSHILVTATTSVSTMDSQNVDFMEDLVLEATLDLLCHLCDRRMKRTMPYQSSRRRREDDSFDDHVLSDLLVHKNFIDALLDLVDLIERALKSEGGIGVGGNIDGRHGENSNCRQRRQCILERSCHLLSHVVAEIPGCPPVPERLVGTLKKIIFSYQNNKNTEQADDEVNVLSSALRAMSQTLIHHRFREETVRSISFEKIFDLLPSSSSPRTVYATLSALVYAQRGTYIHPLSPRHARYLMGAENFLADPSASFLMDQRARHILIGIMTNLAVSRKNQNIYRQNDMVFQRILDHLKQSINSGGSFDVDDRNDDIHVNLETLYHERACQLVCNVIATLPDEAIHCHGNNGDHHFGTNRSSWVVVELVCSVMDYYLERGETFGSYSNHPQDDDRHCRNIQRTGCTVFFHFLCAASCRNKVAKKDDFVVGNVDQLVEAQIHLIVVRTTKALQKFPSDLDVMLVAFGTLWHITYLCSSITLLNVLEPILEVIKRSLQTFSSSISSTSVLLKSRALEAMRSILQNIVVSWIDNYNVFGEALKIASLVAIALPSPTQLQFVCDILDYATTQRRGLARESSTYRLLLEMQESCLCLLAYGTRPHNLPAQADNQEQHQFHLSAAVPMAVDGLLDSVKNAMFKCQTDLEVQRLGCSILIGLYRDDPDSVSPPDDNAEVDQVAVLLSHLLEVSRIHLANADEGFQTQLFGLFLALLRRVRSHISTSLQDIQNEVVESTLDSMDRHPHCPAVQLHGSKILVFCRDRDEV